MSCIPVFTEMYESREEVDILEYMRDNSSSIEIMKDGELQKIHFRVKDVVSVDLIRIWRIDKLFGAKI